MQTKHGELVTEAPADDSLEGTTIAEQRDPETYDDTEFYQNLLREFLDGKQGAIASVYSVSGHCMPFLIGG